MVRSEVGYATQVSTKPFSCWLSSKKDWSLWSTVPDTSLPAHDEQAPARHEYGRSSPCSSAASRMYWSSTEPIRGIRKASTTNTEADTGLDRPQLVVVPYLPF